MFKTQKELVDKLFYKGYNPKLILCNLKQDQIIRIASKDISIPSPKNGIYIIEFKIKDCRLIRRNSYDLNYTRTSIINFIIDAKNKKINEIKFKYRAANNSGYIKNFSSIDNINYLLNQNILVYRNYIIGFLFTNYVKQSIEEFSRRFEV